MHHCISAICNRGEKRPPLFGSFSATWGSNPYTCRHGASVCTFDQTTNLIQRDLNPIFTPHPLNREISAPLTRERQLDHSPAFSLSPGAEFNYRPGSCCARCCGSAWLMHAACFFQSGFHFVFNYACFIRINKYQQYIVCVCTAHTHQA